MLTCVEFVELVTAYLEDTLDAETRQRLVAHLVACEGCAGYLGQLRATVRALAELPADQLSGEARDRLLAAFQDRDS